MINNEKGNFFNTTTDLYFGHLDIMKSYTFSFGDL